MKVNLEKINNEIDQEQLKQSELKRRIEELKSINLNKKIICNWLHESLIKSRDDEKIRQNKWINDFRIKIDKIKKEIDIIKDKVENYKLKDKIDKSNDYKQRNNEDYDDQSNLD